MKSRTFGKTGVRVSEMGLGCWQLGGTDWGNVEDKVALEILSAAADAGVDFFDTADVYGNGRSETLIGRFLKERKAKIFVATKLGRTSSLYPDKYTEAGVRTATEASLKRLGVDVLDLTQLHCIPTEEFRKGDVFEWLRKLQREGKIRYFGASVESMEEARVCLEQPGLASLQIIFNIFRQKPVQALFPKAREKGVAIIVRLPLASGLLSGKLTKQSKFPQNDHRNYNRDGQFFNVGETFAGLPYEKGVELADALKPLTLSGLTMAQMTQRWILDHDVVSVVIPGASRPDQARANAAVSDVKPLDAKLHEKLQQFYEREVAAHIRGPY
ncbi:MAG TPA: aldo/keto reductase [Candidatus Angelobacter sp.]|nr:aldo/keto reductase [Candidatus Angelobacter sp.]